MNSTFRIGGADDDTMLLFVERRSNTVCEVSY